MHRSEFNIFSQRNTTLTVIHCINLSKKWKAYHALDHRQLIAFSIKHTWFFLSRINSCLSLLLNAIYRVVCRKVGTPRRDVGYCVHYQYNNTLHLSRIERELWDEGELKCFFFSFLLLLLLCRRFIVSLVLFSSFIRFYFLHFVSLSKEIRWKLIGTWDTWLITRGACNNKYQLL